MGKEEVKKVLNEQVEKGISFKFIEENCATIRDLKKLVESAKYV